MSVEVLVEKEEVIYGVFVVDIVEVDVIESK